MFVSFNSKHQLLTSTEHMSSPSDFSGVRVARSLVLCVMFYRWLFVLCLVAIVISALFQSTDSDYPFGSFKLSLINVRLHVYYIHCDVYHIALFDWLIYFQMINIEMIWVSEWLLLSSISTISQLIMSRTSCVSVKWLWCLFCTRPTH